ncbi:hypothetical protein AB4Y88_20065 [Paenarthrobacter sp. RAF9]
MVGHGQNDTGEYGTGGVKASETTSIHLTPVRNEVQIGKFRLTFYLSPARTAGNV